LTQCHILYINTMRNDTKQLDERRGYATAGARARAAVPTGAVGQSRGPAASSRNKATLAAATLLDGEALGLTRTAIEAA
jgi:hypothetical protein